MARLDRTLQLRPDARFPPPHSVSFKLSAAKLAAFPPFVAPMNAKRLSILLAIPVVVALLATAMPAGADTDAATVRRLRESGEILPLEKILERARKERPGEVLETELERKGGRPVYEVEILDAQGRVWELKFDARSGELLRQKQDD